MNKDKALGLLIGVISYLLFIWIVFSNNWGFLISIFIYPFLYVFPELRDPNAGMAGLPIYMLSLLLSIFLIPFLFWLIGKIFKAKIRFAEIIIGFLSTAIILNIVKIVFDR